jgi:hypothetical protein
VRLNVAMREAGLCSRLEADDLVARYRPARLPRRGWYMHFIEILYTKWARVA